jgi:hypothetical protein
MNRLRMVAIAAMSCCAVMLIGAGSASAQSGTTSVPMTQKVAITGAAKNGKKFTGTYTIDRFEKSGGKLVAVGTLKGKLKGRTVSRKNVAIPAALTGSGSSDAQSSQAASCSILHLVLGPLDLNLLGLRVQLNTVHLDITAIPGAGNLLGNLLCALTGILDQNGALSGAINNLASALNALLALLPTNPTAAGAAVAGR